MKSYVVAIENDNGITYKSFDNIKECENFLWTTGKCIQKFEIYKEISVEESMILVESALNRLKREIIK